MNSSRRRSYSKPRWVLVRENEEARAAAARDARKNPADVINARVRASAEYAAALEAVRQAIVAFYSASTSDEELIARIRAEGGRTAIRNRILRETVTAQVFQSELFGSAPLASFISGLDLQDMETAALVARRRAQGSAS